jgi:prepilin-type N-terminal cleavage/methylation domain-containing protein
MAKAGPVLARRERGLTLMEVMIALAIIGLMMMVGYMGLRDVRQSDLREDTMKVMAALRLAQTTATQTGRHHRVVFDLDEQTLHIERCEGQVRLERFEPGEQPTREDLEERLAERIPRGSDTPELLEATSPEEMMEVAAALAGVRVGSARCMPIGDEAAIGTGGYAIRTERGLEIRNVYAQHLRGPAREGRASVNFFPLGTAEKAIIEVAAERRSYSLLVHRLSGRVELRTGALRDHERYMQLDAAGDREVER